MADRLESRGHGLESLAFGYRILRKPQEAARKYQEIIVKFSLGGEAQEYWILAH